MNDAAKKEEEGRTGQVDLRDDMGRTALWRAVRAGQTTEVASLIGAGADVAVAALTDDNPLNAGATPLFIGCRHGYSEIVSLLVATGVAVDTPTNRGATPLSIACQEEHEQVVSSHAEHKVDREHVHLCHKVDSKD